MAAAPAPSPAPKPEVKALGLALKASEHLDQVAAEFAANVLSGDMRDIPADTPRWLRALLVRGLSVEPDARFPSMTVLLDELGRDHRRLRRLALSIGAMAAGAAAIVAVLQFTMKATSAPPPADRLAAAASDSPASVVTPPAPPAAAPPVVAAPPSAAAPPQPPPSTAAPAAQPSPAPAPPRATQNRPGAVASARPARKFNRAGAIGSIDAYCTIPSDVAHAETGLRNVVLDWGKVTRVEVLRGKFGPYDAVEEVIEIAGQRATYRTVNDFGPLGTLDAKKGDLLALCPQDEDTIHQLPGGPLITTFIVLPLSRPPRLGEIERFAAQHMLAGQFVRDAQSGRLAAGNYLVHSKIGRVDGDQFSVDDDTWRITVAPDALGANRIASGKEMWLVVGDPALESGSTGTARPVLTLHAALDDLFP